MEAKLHTLWQRLRQPLAVVGIVVVSALGIALVVMIIGGYVFYWNWTGITTKTLWDWLQLLIIPAVLALGGFWLNQIQKRRDQRTTQQQVELEHELTRDNQHESLLQAYIDNMSELLLKENLRDSKPEDEVRKIARVRTLTILARLDPIRKRNVLQFLYESDLIKKNQSIVSLKGADLSGAMLGELNLHEADLRRVNLKEACLDWVNISSSNLSKADLGKATFLVANLSGVDLSGAILCESNLSEAYLNDADLSIANLEKAHLDRADLSNANLSGAEVTDEQLAKVLYLNGTTMPDGSIHP